MPGNWGGWGKIQRLQGVIGKTYKVGAGNLVIFSPELT